MIKFLDLHKINERFRKEIDARIKQVIDSGWYLLGSQDKEFEKNFAAYCGVKHCIGVANGLDALNLIIKAYGFGAGDEIIVPANTYIASILAISENGCTPVLVEPDLNTYNINPDLIEEKITSKTKAIMVVHLYGQAVEMEKTYSEKMAQARDEAGEIIKQATLTAQKREKEIIEAAHEEVASMTRRAETQIALERKKAYQEIRDEISDISVAIAGKMVQREINADDHRALISQFIENVGEA